ncbi:MAG TPA: dihydrolipoyl dehydrogenase [Rhizomicrobium sp.]|nr:dihydrolipoyl dehydrogenase [Rhizomicrobium sp.]
MGQSFQRMAVEWLVSLSLAVAWVIMVLLQLARRLYAHRRRTAAPKSAAARVATLQASVASVQAAAPRTAPVATHFAATAAEPSSRGEKSTMSDTFDVVVIGGGPGGYNAAIRAGQLGMSAACIDKRGTFGGTCLNIGCIPSKALLYASEMYEAAGEKFAKLGIKANASVDLPGMMAHKTKVVGELTKGVEFLLKKNKCEGIIGEARITNPGQVVVKTPDGATRTLQAKNIVIATGSDVAPLPGVTIDEDRIVSSTGALSLKSVPKRLLVVGAGYIGLELGSVWRRLGSEVTVVEFLDRITPGLDLEVAKQFQRLLQRQGMKFFLSTKVAGIEKKGDGVRINVESSDGQKQALEADVVMVCIGRRPYTDGLGLAEAGVKLDPRGRVITDAHYKTNVPGIWSIGDCREGPMLAHKAEDEAVACIERMAGKAGHVNYDAIPAVVYTAPEVASVGKTEEELKAANVTYKAGKFPFTANARAKTIAATEGFVKVLADAKTDRVLGVHILGHEAGSMISEAALAIEFGASSEDIARTSHPHPTLSEAVRQAAMGVEGWTMQM